MMTSESCPVCGYPATCEHGWVVNDRPSHIWHCRMCGEHTAVLSYACAECEKMTRGEVVLMQADDQRLRGGGQ